MVDADAKRKVARGLLGISDLPPIAIVVHLLFILHIDDI